MSLFEVVPSHPGVLGVRDEWCVDSDSRPAVVEKPEPVKRDGAAIGFAMRSLVVASDAEISRNNRLHLLQNRYERWRGKRAMVAHNNMEGEDMGKSVLGVCEVCGERGQLRSNHGKQMDTGCASIYAHLFNRLDLVAKVVVAEDLAGKFLARVAALSSREEMITAMQPYLPDEVSVMVSNQALDEIAKAIGHIGDRGDNLVESVRNLAKELESYREERDRHGRFLVALREITRVPLGPVEDLLAAVSEEKKQSVAAIIEWRMRVEDTQRAMEDICRAVGLPYTEGVELKRMVMDVAQVAARLEEDERLRTAGLVGEMETVESLQADLESYRNLYQAENEEKVRLEEQLLNSKQIIDRIHAVVGRDVSVDQLADVIAAVKQMSAKDILDGCISGASANSSMRDTVLLDLALDALRGNVIGLEADRIAMLREV